MARGLNGTTEMFNERENELIAWRSLDDADIVNAGSVRFEPSSEGHGSVVRVSMNYNPPAGTIGKTLRNFWVATRNT